MPEIFNKIVELINENKKENLEEIKSLIGVLDSKIHK